MFLGWMKFNPTIQLTLDQRDSSWSSWSFLNQLNIKNVLETTLSVTECRVLKEVELEVLLVSDKEMSQYTEEYGPEPGPTNVLSFSLLDAHQLKEFPQGIPVPLGSIVLGFEYIVREVQMYQIEPMHHVVHLLTHGMLHLLGYDHISAEEREIMEGFEQKICEMLGYTWRPL